MRLLLTILFACFSSGLAHGYSNPYPNTTSTTADAWGATWTQFNLSATSSCGHTDIGQYSTNRYVPNSNEQHLQPIQQPVLAGQRQDLYREW